MLGFTIADDVGLALFLAAWIAYYLFVERASAGRKGLNGLMNEYRLRWMLEMQGRDNRIVDSSLLMTIQTSTSFFASTSLIAIGGTLALLRGTDDVLKIFADLPLGIASTRGAFEAKVLGLTIIFGYAFFKFSWASRLYGYVAILIGSVPPKQSSRVEQKRLVAIRAAEMNIVAGRHFNRGQRAFFFAVAYLGWFVSPYVLIGATALTLGVMWMRQFGSDARAAVMLTVPDDLTIED
ncbi:DUF599 domain-containing protein [Lichenihabitans psoromatis]|uniref:DUF599 domain-containing protein n=1 Tax=Lichenihabitans psoromatis TaxID=2528642 RepID=UPI00103831B2|nr:DUF599 family protein [Lichenihabitans psoromatis]